MILMIYTQNKAKNKKTPCETGRVSQGVIMIDGNEGKRNQTLITLSANCMDVTMSSMLVVSPTCFCSRIPK